MLKNSKTIRNTIADEDGSASVEFVLLAIPLFLPILIFLVQFENLSSSELIARSLVRESLRAFVTADNPWSASNRAKQVLEAGAKAQGLTNNQIDSLDLNFQCSDIPCLSPGGRVQATLKLKIGNQNREVVARAEEYISPWQWNGIGTGLVSRAKSALDVQS